MLLVADIGNTEAVFGLWQNKTLLSKSRFRTQNHGTADEWNFILRAWLMAEGASFRHFSVEEGIISSVVPTVTDKIIEAFYQLGAKRVETIHPKMKLPFSFDYPAFETLGADRIANAIAGVLFYGPHLIIVDIGTAITFCLIIENQYLGGIIAPGPATAAQALFQKTAKLPQVEFTYCENPLGKSTTKAIEAGLYFGFKGLLKELIDNLKLTVNVSYHEKIQILGTGGISENLAFAPEIFTAVDRNLTLRGLMAARDFLFL